MITLDEFLERLLRVGAGRPRGLPRKLRDRQILMKSILLTLDSARSYTEPEINAALEHWNAEVVPAIRTDYVTLRRMLVEHGLLERTVDGRVYRVGFPVRAPAFELEVDELDVRAMVAAYRQSHPPR